MSDRYDIEAALSALAQSKDYRVLKRLPRAAQFDAQVNSSLVAIAIDVETTGLDVEVDEVIELAMIKFSFSRDGRIGKVLSTYQTYNEPSKPIPEQIVQLTGIDQPAVAGHKIDTEKLAQFTNGVALVVAHNAAFDRPFCECIYSEFANLHWACSATEIDWRAEGLVGSRLEYIANSFGFFYDAHRAMDDCNALTNILSFDLPRSKRSTLSALLEMARRTTIRIFAEGTPFDRRLELKRNGYRWNDGLNGYPRAWWKDVSTQYVDTELEHLRALNKDSTAEPKLFRLTGKDRFRSLPQSAAA